MIELARLIEKSLILLTYTPFAEEQVVGILNTSDGRKEYELAMKCLETRTRGTVNLLTKPLTVVLELNHNIDKDVCSTINELLWLSRVMEMLRKDTIEDLNKDIRLGDLKPSSVFALKYGTGSEDFNRRISFLTDIYFKKAITLKEGLRCRPEVYDYLIKDISRNRAKILECLHRANSKI